MSDSGLAAERGFALLDLGRADQAKDCFVSALAAGPNDPRLLAGLAQALADLGDAKGAIDAADAAVAAEPDWHFVHEVRAVVQANLGSTKEASASAERLVSLASEYPHGHVLIAEIALMRARTRRRIQQAKAAADRALALDATSVAAHRVRAKVALAEGESEAAEELCRAALRISPEDHESLLLLGRIQGLTPDAIDSYIQAGRLRPADSRALLAVGKMAAAITAVGGVMAGAVLVGVIEATVWIMPLVLRLALFAAGGVSAFALLHRRVAASMIQRRLRAGWDPGRKPRRYSVFLGIRVPEIDVGPPRFKRGRRLLAVLMVLAVVMCGGSIVQLTDPEAQAQGDQTTETIVVTMIPSAALLVVSVVLLLLRERTKASE